MVIPTVKTLLTYRHVKDGTYKKMNVLCEYLHDSEDDRNKYSEAEFMLKVEARCPFEFEGLHSSIYPYGVENQFNISFEDGYKVVEFVDVFVATVLEYKGKIFKLEETHFDFKEFDYEN
ncbi:hypothetical protein Q7A53_05345 [Halobacillus rhizosphaerae]|uniref:hypothetical protein n=1 Tax=Halobacillus rhizosphaerae TaxID=3064889 RepID=UPI00398A9732